MPFSAQRRCIPCIASLVQGLVFAQLVAASEAALTVGGQRLRVIGDSSGFELNLQQASLADGLDVARLTLTHQRATAPPQLTVQWSRPSHDIAGVWTSDFSASRTSPPDWREVGKLLHSMLTQQAAVLTLFGSDDSNRITVAVSDAINPVTMDARIREEDARIHLSIDLFSERHQKVKEISVEIRFDQRDIPFDSALKGVSGWWAGMPGHEPAPVPELARQPMYSTWYSYHQNIEPESMLAEVKAAKRLGFQAIIVDDGWQTLDSSRGYAHTGDWKPERLSRIEDFVNAVHAEGMAAILW